MRLIIWAGLVWAAVIQVGCQEEMAIETRSWGQGEVVEIEGILWTAKSPGGNKYYLRMEDNKNPHIISEELDKLERGIKVWVRGTIKYVHYERPADYHSRPSAFALPQTVCYIIVSDFKIIS